MHFISVVRVFFVAIYSLSRLICHDDFRRGCGRAASFFVSFVLCVKLRIINCLGFFFVTSHSLNRFQHRFDQMNFRSMWQHIVMWQPIHDPQQHILRQSDRMHCKTPTDDLWMRIFHELTSNFMSNAIHRIDSSLFSFCNLVEERKQTVGEYLHTTKQRITRKKKLKTYRFL